MRSSTTIFTRRTLLTLGAAAVLLAACAGTPPAILPARPIAGSTLSLPENWHARVLVELADSIVLTLPSGDRQLQQFHRSAVFTLDVGNDGAVSLRLDSLTPPPSSDGSGGGHPTPALATWTGRADDPRVTAYHVSAGGEFAEELTSVVRILLPRYPAGGARDETSWTDSANGRVRVDIFSAMERRSTTWTMGPDRSLAVREEYEQMGNGAEGGQRVTMTSQGRRSGVYYSTVDGHLTRASLVDSAAMLISLPGSGQVVPTVRLARASVRFVSIPRDSSEK
jgi:hypothetical protein